MVRVAACDDQRPVAAVLVQGDKGPVSNRHDVSPVRRHGACCRLATLSALCLVFVLVAVCLILERSWRRASFESLDVEGREDWIPNYRHIWFSGDPAFVNGGRLGDHLCTLGAQMQEHQGDWQAYCREDMDGDGLTNGQEMGDPCCLWTPEKAVGTFSLGRQAEYRRWDLSHPAGPNRQDLHSEPAKCSEGYNESVYVEQFRSFYFRKAGGPYEPVPLVPAKVVSLAMLLLLLFHWFRDRSMAADVCPWLYARKADLSPKVSCAIGVLAFVYTDITSGIVHLILDYAPHWIPVLGGLARGFQYHHHDPTAIIRISWYSYVSHVHLLIPLVAVLLLLSDASRVQRLFWFWVAIFVHLFQTTHRWAHFPPESLNWAVRSLQGTGMLLTHEHHMSHHQDLEVQFTILSGHTDHLLDGASKLVPPWRYDLWTLIGVVWFLGPILLDLHFRSWFDALDQGAVKARKEDDGKDPAHAEA